MSERNLTDAELALAGVGVAHHHGGGAYIKETLIPTGASLTQHAHDHDHLSYLVAGTVLVQIGGDVTTVHAPRAMLIRKGEVHGVTAISDARWLCVWSEDRLAVEDQG